MAVVPKTDAAPLTANPQSIKFPTRLVPLGKGIPIKNPNGDMNTIDIIGEIQ